MDTYDKPTISISHSEGGSIVNFIFINPDKSYSTILYYVNKTYMCIKHRGKLMHETENKERKIVTDNIIQKMYGNYIIDNMHGNLPSIQYISNFKFHREDGPAYILYYDQNNVSKVMYYQDNKLHRSDGPAIIEYNWLNKLVYTAHYKNGRAIVAQRF